MTSTSKWVAEINASWSKALQSADLACGYAVDTGSKLIAAKADIGHGPFMEMVRDELPFSVNKADQLMKVARRIGSLKSQPAMILPQGWAVLAELAQLTEKDFKNAVDTGVISQKTTRRGARAIVSAYKVPKGEKAKQHRSDLPTPSEAKQIAQTTGRIVLASDGKYRTPMGEEQHADYLERRDQAFGIQDAIKLIAECPSTPQQWLSSMEHHWMVEFDVGSVDAAIEWLMALKPFLRKKLKVIDGGKSA